MKSWLVDLFSKDVSSRQMIRLSRIFKFHKVSHVKTLTKQYLCYCQHR